MDWLCLYRTFPIKHYPMFLPKYNKGYILSKTLDHCLESYYLVMKEASYFIYMTFTFLY